MHLGTPRFRRTSWRGVRRPLIAITGFPHPDAATGDDHRAETAYALLYGPQSCSLWPAAARAFRRERCLLRRVRAGKPDQSRRGRDYIPRLGDVVDIIANQMAPFDEHPQGRSAESRQAAGILRLALDLDYLQAGGFGRLDALALLATRRGTYDPALLSTVTSEASSDREVGPVVAVELHQLRPGMVVTADITDVSGRLLVGRGHEVSDRLIELIRNRRATCPVVEPMRVTVIEPTEMVDS